MPTDSDNAVHGTLPDFDDFYLASRRRLVLSAYALTGDLAAARHGVGDGVRRGPAPLAQGAPAARPRGVGPARGPGRWPSGVASPGIWHREKGLSAEQKGVLDALHHLPDQQRKVLLLAHLAALSTADIGRELGETTARVEDRLRTASESFCRETGDSPGRCRRGDRVAGPDRRGGRTARTRGRSTGAAGVGARCTWWAGPSYSSA